MGSRRAIVIPLRDDNPAAARPVITLAILFAVAVVFLWQQSLPPAGFEAAVYALGLIPGVLFGLHTLPDELSIVSSEVTVLTSMFTIGVSGAISGVLGAYLLLFPKARVLVLIPIGFFLYTVLWPARLVLLGWFALQFVGNVLADSSAGGVAFRAHVGGFLAGMLLIPLFRRPHFRLHNPLRG